MYATQTSLHNRSALVGKKGCQLALDERQTPLVEGAGRHEVCGCEYPQIAYLGLYLTIVRAHADVLDVRVHTPCRRQSVAYITPEYGYLVCRPYDTADEEHRYREGDKEQYAVFAPEHPT